MYVGSKGDSVGTRGSGSVASVVKGARRSSLVMFLFRPTAPPAAVVKLIN